MNTNYSAALVPVLALVCVLGGRGGYRGPRKASATRVPTITSVNQTVAQLPLAMGLYVDDRPCSQTRKTLGQFDVQPGCRRADVLSSKVPQNKFVFK